MGTEHDFPAPNLVPSANFECRHKAYFMVHDRNDENCLLAKALELKAREKRA